MPLIVARLPARRMGISSPTGTKGLTKSTGTATLEDYFDLDAAPGYLQGWSYRNGPSGAPRRRRPRAPGGGFRR